MVKVGILGATAYTGCEIVKRLVKHTGVVIDFVSSKSYAGKKFNAVLGETEGYFEQLLISPGEAEKRDVDVVFSCLPHAVSADLLMAFINRGVRVIDLSADFRIKDATVYEKWYNHKHPAPELLKEAIFGLPEHYRHVIKSAYILANPGCYPTSIMLPLLPLMKDPGTEVDMIIADSKSGVSGAGRSLKLASHYPEANENFSAYSIGRKHRHISEIDQELSLAAGKNVNITFSPHLTPINRGILSTIYINTNRTAEECLSIVRNFYREEPFVRIRDSLPQVKFVSNTNYCDITFTGGEDAQPVIAVSAIDNLVKGASGQAIQNMNIMFGFDEKESLI